MNELVDGDEYRALLKDLYYIYAGNSESDPVFGQTLKMTKRFRQHLKANDAFYDFLYGKNIGEIRVMNISVSYTHLDVYKRQTVPTLLPPRHRSSGSVITALMVSRIAPIQR